MSTGDSNLDIALRMRAEASQAKAALAEVQAQIEGVEKTATKANASQVKSTRDVVAAQNAAMTSYQKFTELARNADSAMTALKSGTLTSAAFEKAVNDLGKAVDAGVLTQEEYVAALALADKAKVKDIALTEAQSVANKKAALSAKASGEIATAASEVLSGNFGRLRRTGAAFANQAGLLSALMSPMGIAIAGAAVAVGAFVMAIIKGGEESDKFNRALIATGSASTSTAGQLVEVANRVGAATGRYGDAVAALTELANTGKYSRTQLEQLTQTAAEFATMTGGKVADGIKFVDGMMSGNIDTIRKQDQELRVLTASQLEEIQRLFDLGQSEKATEMYHRLASKAVHDRAGEVKESAGIMERAWTGVKEAASAAWAAMKDVGATHSIGQQLKDAMAALADARGTHLDRAGNLVQNASPQALAALQAKISDLRRQLVQQGYEQTQAAVNQNAETKAKQGLQYLSQFQSPLTQLNNAKAQAKAAYDKAMLGNLTAEQVAQAKAQYQQALKVAQQQFDSASKKESGNVDSAQHSAAMAAAQAAVKQVQDIYSNGQKALDAQHKAGLVSDAAYYDAERGMLTVWENDKVAALEKEKTAAQSHVKTQADRIKADQKVAEIDQQITQVHAEAASKRQQIDANEQQAIKKTEAAWEKFRASLGTPLEIHTDKIVAQVGELDKYLKNGDTGGVQGFADAFGRILEGAGGNGPRGASSLLAGSRFAAQIAQVKDYYSDVEDIQAAALRKAISDNQNNLDAQLAAERKFNEASKQLARDKAAAVAAIHRQEAQFALSSAQQGFAALAQVYAQAYGEQSKQARLAFALQKASTLANAILAIQENIANSSKMGFPWNIISIAGAIAQGAAVLASIRSANLNVGGYSEGGYTGAGGKYQPAGIVHAGEIVWSQADIARAGGVSSVEAMRLRGYADGGYVSPPPPTPSQLGFKAPSTPSINGGQLMVQVSPVTVVVHSSGGGDDVQSKQSTGSDGSQLLELFLGAAAKDVNQGGTLSKAIDKRWVLKRKGNSYG